MSLERKTDRDSPPVLTGTPRCGDREREEMAAYLGDMFAEGYLSQREYDVRHEQVFGAVTQNQLKLLRSDLPVTIETWRQRQQEPGTEKKRKLPDPPFLATGVFIVLCGILGIVTTPTLTGVAWAALLMLLGGQMIFDSKTVKKMMQTRDKRGKTC